MMTSPEWRAYLIECSERKLPLLNAWTRSRLSAGQLSAGWLGHPGASEGEVAAAERRLEVDFPTSLRTFLLTSNGWSTADHIDEVYSAEKIDWFRNTAQGRTSIDAYLDFFGEAERTEGEDAPRQIDVFERALIVADGVDHWLLDPAGPGPDGEWVAWRYQTREGEMVRFANFGRLFAASTGAASSGKAG